MAKINIYCDESCHLEHDGIKPMLLGCVWCEEQKKDAIFKRLRAIKVKYGLKPTCELKWNAVSQTIWEMWKMKEFLISEDVKECHGQSLLLKFYLRRER